MNKPSLQPIIIIIATTTKSWWTKRKEEKRKERSPDPSWNKDFISTPDYNNPDMCFILLFFQKWIGMWKLQNGDWVEVGMVTNAVDLLSSNVSLIHINLLEQPFFFGALSNIHSIHIKKLIIIINFRKKLLMPVCSQK